MQVQVSNEIAVLPFRNDVESASVVTDGEKVRAFTGSWSQAFESIWWAVETLNEMGFHFDRENMKPFAGAAFNVIAAPQGWEIKRIGVHTYGCLGGKAKVFAATLWECQVECIRESLKYIR